jgi:hypothetical protein
MIRMEQPSFCFHSCDVSGLRYEMWKMIDGIEGTTVDQLVSLILAAQLEAMRDEGSFASEYHHQHARFCGRSKDRRSDEKGCT